MNKSIFYWALIFFFAPILLAQEIKPVISNVKYQIVTESLVLANYPQDLEIEINKEINENIQSLILGIPDLNAELYVVSAQLNGEQIWLIRSDNAARNAKVLAWNYNAKTSQLSLYPPDWRTNYRLEITLTIHLIKGTVDNITKIKKVIAEAEIQGRKYLCNVQGRGNEVIIKNKDE